MFEILYKYFIINRKAVVPGIGVFYIHRQPASFDFSNKAFIAPAAHISFKASDAIADTKFYSFTSKEQQTDEAEAAKNFTEFSNKLQRNLEASGTVELPGFGVISKDAAGALQFRPARQLPSFFKDVAAERIIREVPDQETAEPATTRRDKELKEVAGEEAGNGKTTKNYWWVMAVILAVGAIAAIAYYYYQNGSLR